MSDGAEFFFIALQKGAATKPDDMSVADWKCAQELAQTQRYLDRSNLHTVRDLIEDHTELPTCLEKAIW
jgi:hypothetical protein